MFSFCFCTIKYAKSLRIWVKNRFFNFENVFFKRNNIYETYYKSLNQYKYIKFQNYYNIKNYIVNSNRWLTTFYFDMPHSKRKLKFIIENLNKKHIEARPLWKPMHMQPVFKNNKL